MFHNALMMPARRSRGMSRRRLVVCLAAFAASLWLRAVPAQAAGNDAAASQFIQATGDQLIQVINASTSEKQRTDQIQQIVDQAVDVPNVARFCLGRYARTATPEQLSQYAGLFRRSLAVNISSKMGQYRGVTFKITRTLPRDGLEEVDTVVTRPNNAPNIIQWMVSFQSGKPMIIDLFAEGTSLRLTQRSDYASFLAHNDNDVGRLIAAMRHQLGG